MTELHLYIMAFFAFLIYSVWRYSSAVSARGELAKELDSYLAKDVNETLKFILVGVYEDSLKPWVIWSVMFSSLTVSRKDKKASRGITAILREMSEGERKEFFVLAIGLITVNVRLAPLSYLIFAILIAFKTLSLLVFSKSMNIRNSFFTFANRVESAYVKTI